MLSLCVFGRSSAYFANIIVCTYVCALKGFIHSLYWTGLLDSFQNWKLCTINSILVLTYWFMLNAIMWLILFISNRMAYPLHMYATQCTF